MEAKTKTHIIILGAGVAAYAELASEAMESWKTDQALRPYFHQSGMLFAESFGKGEACFSNLRTLGANTPKILPRKDTLKQFSMFQQAKWAGDENYYNPQSGWADADQAMESFLQAAIDEGVNFIQAEAKGLVLESDGSCGGIRILVNGMVQDLRADHTTICLGAYTEKFLADAAPHRMDLQVHGKLTAAMSLQCKGSATHPTSSKSSKGHRYWECIPLEDGYFKINIERSFTNMIYHEGVGKDISVPLSNRDTWVQDVPEVLKRDVECFVENTFGGHISGMSFVGYRMCCDAITPDQNFIIDNLCPGLMICTGLSFHGYKVLPTIGKRVVEKMDGVLDPELGRRWALNRVSTDPVCEVYYPKQDLKDIGGWPNLEESHDTTMALPRRLPSVYFGARTSHPGERNGRSGQGLLVAQRSTYLRLALKWTWKLALASTVVLVHQQSHVVQKMASASETGPYLSQTTTGSDESLGEPASSIWGLPSIASSKGLSGESPSQHDAPRAPQQRPRIGVSAGQDPVFVHWTTRAATE
ncbi:FAD dependent oxidoreductase-domain-containing protein [Apiosordaria backusii]|uniref:FAD dependent oxidoreductase-domain-containing protein n=1 Tax=Apiosordaria backusii TaxID=314023 RepID=A0AA39ZP65_9PEZI|nr:FAD dependent oxidoreductase-domain-containing protein [Apiosordaria backusii]